MGERQETIEEHQIRYLECLRVLVKRRILVLLLCGAALLLSAGYSLTLPNVYSATARVLPPQKEGGAGLSSLLGQMGGLSGFATGGLGAGGSDLYQGILKSRSLGDEVMERLNLREGYRAKSLAEAREILAASVKVQAGKDGIISITVDDREPGRAALIANTFADQLGRTMVRLNLSTAGSERLFLESRLRLVRKDLKAAEDDLRAYSQKNRIVQVDAQAKSAIESIARVKAEIATREVQLEALRSYQTDSSPEVKLLAAGITQLKRELARLTGGGAGAGESIPAMGDVPGLGLEYARKMRELKTQEALYEQLTKQYEVAKLSEAKDSSTLQVLDQAIVPAKKSGPSRSRIVITATAAAFFVSILLVFALERLEGMPGEERRFLKSLIREALTLRAQGGEP